MQFRPNNNGQPRPQTNGQRPQGQPVQFRPNNNGQPRPQTNGQTQGQNGFRNANQPRPQNAPNTAPSAVPNAVQKQNDERIAQRNARFEQKPQFNTQKPQKTQKPQRPAQQPQVIRPMPNANTETSGNVLDSQNRGTRLAGGRVVDTRTTTVDLSKYDERLEKFVPDADKNAAGEKQKLKKQNNRQNDREKERMAMEKLKKQEAAERAKKQQLSITLPETMVVNELAMKLRVTVADVVKKLMMLGVMASVNQAVDYDTAALVALEFGAKVSKEVVVTIEEKLFDDSSDDNDALVERAPVVCVMGHVDHGKTSLLDAIRNTHVTTGEAGGITQHIGAYRVNTKGKDITFLDTPGHEAFTAMRARGAQSTDIAILVVAADDGIMPQTIEAINHAKAAGVDIIVAINKMDKYGASPDNVMQELTKYELVPEQWGGDVICVPVSALTRMGIDDLLDNILLVAEMKELKANPDRRAKGIVIEASLDKGRGPVATVLVQNGTLNNGDVVIAGTAVGRVRAMIDDKGKTIKTAGPSVPVEIVGLAEVPQAGDEFNAVEDERMARELAEQRRSKAKEDEFKANSKVNLDDLFAQISSGQKDLNIIVKADVGGSAEAVKQSLVKLTNEEVKVNIIHTGVGGITEGDVMFAAASNAIIVGFNVRPDKSAIDSAERHKVDIRTYRIIYECIEEISAAMKGMLAPKFRENVLGHAEVRQTIHVPNVGTIAGSYVQDGKVTRSAQIRVLRDGIVIFEDKISSLRRFKDDVKDVAQGFECGVGLDRFNDIKVGDILEAFEMEEIKPE
ncbi:MAG: translation initiation factor IF-2 [Eubacteriales bacterium]